MKIPDWNSLYGNTSIRKVPDDPKVATDLLQLAFSVNWKSFSQRVPAEVNQGQCSGYLTLSKWSYYHKMAFTQFYFLLRIVKLGKFS